MLNGIWHLVDDFHGTNADGTNPIKQVNHLLCSHLISILTHRQGSGSEAGKDIWARICIQAGDRISPSRNM